MATQQMPFGFWLSLLLLWSVMIGKATMSLRSCTAFFPVTTYLIVYGWRLLN